MKKLIFSIFVMVLFRVIFIVHVIGKECTNIPSQFPSPNSEFQPFLSNFDWEMMYKKIKIYDGNMNQSSNFLKEVSLHDVRLDPESIHGIAQQTNLEYLLMLDVDNLVWSFRKASNLSTPGTPYGGWESSTEELRGHFVGHYLSATAQMWASTHNETLYKKMNAVVSALNECQFKIGTGYLSAFPTEQFDRVDAVKLVWAPYYTIHKIMAGLLDQYTLGLNPQALKMVLWMADYFANRVQNVISKYSLERHYMSLNIEHGGMNDVYYRLYAITGTRKHLVMGTLFDKPCFLGMLALQEDSLSGFHVNTHIPIVIGTQIRYELTGDPLYKAMGTFFMEAVNSSHAYATGGTSFNESWTDPKRLATTLSSVNEESCVTYNMLKVSRHLFRWTKEMEYADYYERALTNGVLSIQRGREPGVMLYLLSLAPGGGKARNYRGWGTPCQTFWCCYGTGIESFSKLGDSIYFIEENQQVLYIIQFISSSFNWKSGGLVVNQRVETLVSSDNVLRVNFSFSTSGVTGTSSIFNIRIPLWVDSNGAHAKLNGEALPLPVPGEFMSISRKWSSTDKLSLELPIQIRMEAIKDDRSHFASVQATLYGPYLLAGLTDGDWDVKIGTNNIVNAGWLTAVPSTYNSQLVSFYQQSDSNSTLVLTASNNTLGMKDMPTPGTDAALQATFRLVSNDLNASQLFSKVNFIGKLVMLEPFHFPGKTVQPQSEQTLNLVISNPTSVQSSTFRVVDGLDKKDTISLESESQKGCFLYNEVKNNSNASIKLSCQTQSTDPNFPHATSFILRKGLAEYHPISFVANGLRRKFLLMPLLRLRDESNTVYFNMTI